MEKIRGGGVNKTRFLLDATLYKLGWLEPLVMTGIKRQWFNEFNRFWKEVLNGRPISIMDFHMLKYTYRVRGQNLGKLEWNTPKEHMDNWKKDETFYSLFNLLYSNALYPFRNLSMLRPKFRVLEYGCSHAPYYRSWRKYYNHIETSWVLADLKNITFLFSNYMYSSDYAIEKMILINEFNMANPLCNLEGEFDVIILTTVLEHVDSPVNVCKMLLGRLKKGGYFVFDYIKSDGLGLDSKQGLDERIEALQYILNTVKIVKGQIPDIDKSVGLCIGIKS